VTPVEFRGDLWHQKTRVPVLSCGVLCVILRFAVFVEHRLVTDTDTDTDRRTQAHGLYRGCIASRGNKIASNIYNFGKGQRREPALCVSVKSAHFGSLIPIPARKASWTARRQGGGVSFVVELWLVCTRLTGQQQLSSSRTMKTHCSAAS